MLLIVTLTFTKEQKRCQLTEQKKKDTVQKSSQFLHYLMAKEVVILFLKPVGLSGEF